MARAHPPSWWLVLLLAGLAAAGFAAQIFATDQWVMRVAGFVTTFGTFMSVTMLYRRRRYSSADERMLRNECPACGYPIGESVHCTECGSLLPTPVERAAHRARIDREQQLDVWARKLRNREPRMSGDGDAPRP